LIRDGQDVRRRVRLFAGNEINAGDVARALNANRSTIATRLSQIVKQGEITKASKGYAVK
jgi:hypothetical protein